MNKSKFLITSMLALLTVCSAVLLNTGCETTNAGCEIVTFEGTFAGNFVIGGVIPIPDEDTMIVVINAANNTVTITSKFLGTSFDTDYDPSSGRSAIGPLEIPIFDLGDNQLIDVSIAGGYIEMDNDCSELYVQMNDVSVQDHTFDGFPKPINNLQVSTPNNMRRLN